MTAKAHPCWKDYGLSAAAGRRADEVLAALEAMVTNHGSNLVAIALREATFRAEQLQNLSPAYQRRYRKENGF